MNVNSLHCVKWSAEKQPVTYCNATFPAVKKLTKCPLILLLQRASGQGVGGKVDWLEAIVTHDLSKLARGQHLTSVLSDITLVHMSQHCGNLHVTWDHSFTYHQTEATFLLWAQLQLLLGIIYPGERRKVWADLSRWMRISCSRIFHGDHCTTAGIEPGMLQPPPNYEPGVLHAAQSKVML